MDDAGLVYELLNADAEDADTVVVLPGRYLDEVYLRAAASEEAPSARAVLLEPPRRIYRGRDVVGLRWYVDNIDGTIEPATFADALVAVELVVQHVARRWGPPRVIGEGQGGELALALALLMPESLAAVTAIDAVIPDVLGWQRAARRADGLPIRMVHRRTPVDPAGALELERLGARVVYADAHGFTSGPRLAEPAALRPS
ncbi:MAG: hypothetical protein JWO02_818 [Solirubrobacterales bacterium]|nr:hypothetical protein [Solirubrobacterales bacterium]